MIEFLSIVFLVLHQIDAAPHDSLLSPRSMVAQGRATASNSADENTMIMVNPHNKDQVMIMNPSGPNPSMAMSSHGNSKMTMNSQSPIATNVNVNSVVTESKPALGNQQTNVQISGSNINTGDSWFSQYTDIDENPRLKVYSQTWGVGAGSPLSKNAEMSLLDSLVNSFYLMDFPANSHSYWSIFSHQPGRTTVISKRNNEVTSDNSVKTELTV